MSATKSPPPAIPGYTFCEGIGAGGFADVFLFTQHSTGRKVAVKVLRSEHLSDRSLEQFNNEANVMAGVSTHPYIVTIHDAGVAADGRPYIVMAHYPLAHFGERARSHHIGVAELLQVGVQVSAAVETAHRSGILHRDIKPANILTSEYGDPGLTDFGIAGVRHDGEITAAGGVSLGFTAPELLVDEHASGSQTSDVYSLGATIYALAVGRSPIHIPGGNNAPMELNRRAAAGEVLSLNRDDLPRSLIHLLTSTLSPSPGRRPQSAASLGQALQDIEQELHLPPTKLVLLGSSDRTVGPVNRSGATEEGTRRRSQVVSPDGRAPQPARAMESAEPQTELRSASHAPPPPTSPNLGRGDRYRSTEPATVARSAAPPPNPTAATPDEVVGDEPRPHWIIPAVGAAVILLLAAIGLVLLPGGSDSEAEAPSTTLPRRNAPADPVARFVGPPENLSLAFGEDGVLALAWDPPVQPAEIDPDEFTYRAYRTLDGEAEPLWQDGEFMTDTNLEVADIDLDGSTELCVEVYAIYGAQPSEPPATACWSESLMSTATTEVIGP